MNITFAPRGLLQIDDCRITYKNFRGEASQFNRQGDRNFSVIIETQEQADALVNDLNEYNVGWNVKIKPPRDEDEGPFMTLPVKVKFNGRGPAVWLVVGDNDPVKLDEEDIGMLDRIDIARVDLDIRPYDDMINGRPFRSAYLQSICVVQDLTRDRFAAKFSRR